MHENTVRFLSPDLNSIEISWKNPKEAIHGWKPNNIPELKLFFFEEWAKFHQATVQD